MSAATIFVYRLTGKLVYNTLPQYPQWKCSRSVCLKACGRFQTLWISAFVKKKTTKNEWNVLHLCCSSTVEAFLWVFVLFWLQIKRLGIGWPVFGKTALTPDCMYEATMRLYVLSYWCLVFLLMFAWPCSARNVKGENFSFLFDTILDERKSTILE